MASQESTGKDQSKPEPRSAAGPKPAKVARPAAKAATTAASPAAASPAGPRRAASEVQASKEEAARAKAATATATAEADADAEADDLEPKSSYFRDLLRDSPSWLTSLIVHMALLLLLALWMLPSEAKNIIGALSVTPNESEEEIEEILDEPIEELQVDVDQLSEVTPQPETDNIQAETMLSPAQDLEAATMPIEMSEVSLDTALQSNVMTEVAGAAMGTGLSGRGATARKVLVAAGGGTPESEKAVALALKWIANHQLPDGGWSFDHRIGQCQGRCGDPGSLANMRNGATAMALLPFLGAGQTHKEGNYQKVVGAGLYYLARSMKVSPKGGDLTDPGHGMYSHGLATIALCEAYGMTQDRALMAPAQAAVNFVVTGQDKVTGGWGYNHGSGNDTSVAGWQIMGMKSGHLAYLQVPVNSFKGSYLFLDSVQAESGAYYGYRGPGKGQATTAVGLLCRMYLGWNKDHPALQRGAQQLAAWGPSTGALYYDYYATQVMFQVTGGKGDVWKAWNDKMRDHLVTTQAKDGHLEGSWGAGDFKSHGGRLYCTSMSCMILEVYYRHMPLYKEAATVEDFPLE